MLHIFLFVLFFAVGSAIIFLLYKKKLNNWKDNLIRQLDAFEVSGLSDDLSGSDKALEIPAELEVVSKRIEKLAQTYNHRDANVASISQSDTLVSKLRKKLDDLYIVNELGQKVTSSLDLQETFDHLSNTINSMMDAAVLELNVLNSTSGKWKIYSSLGNSETEFFESYNHFSAWSYKNNREVFLENAEEHFERYVFQPLTMKDGRMVKSIMVFPILNKDEVSGILTMMSFRKNSFDEYHQNIIRYLLGYISVAIQNSITHEELFVTKQRAERSEKFMQQFLANMSHEIRTPINAVTGMTGLLLQKNPAPDQLKYLESIRNASDSLLIIINDILDLSKIEAGKIEIEKIDMSVEAVVENVIEIIHFKAEEKGLLLEYKVDKKISPVLIGDPTRLTQILLNLIGNAVKFTSKGRIKLDVLRVGNTEKAVSLNRQKLETLQFSVSDTGIGMTKEEQEKLFQDYIQAGSDTTRRYGGTGLGLSISKQLVKLQNGDIEVRSRKNEGSVFVFTLTYPVSSNTTLIHKDQNVSEEMLIEMKGIKLLLADDNEYNRIVVKETLQLKIPEIIIDEALDGIEALSKAKDNSYDIILMDLVMPKMDGLEATRKIRNEFDSSKNKIPIVALTASVVRSEIDKSIAAGMNDFIPKPFKAHELISTIYRTVKKIDSRNIDVVEQEDIQNIKSNDPKNGSSIDISSIHEFTENDPVRFNRCVELFIKQVPENLNNINAAFSGQDYDKLRITTHNLKPQLRIAGLSEALELAEQIELSALSKEALSGMSEKIEKISSICRLAVKDMEKVKKQIQ